MATTHVYFEKLSEIYVTTLRLFGFRADRIQMEIRATATAAAVTQAVLMKALTDAGVLTDAELQAAWVTAQAEDWSDIIPTLTRDSVPVNPEEP